MPLKRINERLAPTAIAITLTGRSPACRGQRNETIDEVESHREVVKAPPTGARARMSPHSGLPAHIIHGNLSRQTAVRV